MFQQKGTPGGSQKAHLARARVRDTLFFLALTLSAIIIIFH